MSALLHRIGGVAYRRPWAVVLTWLFVLGGVLGLALTGGGHISSMTIDGTPSQQVLDQLRAELPAASGGQGTLVFTVPDGERLDTGGRASAIAAAATEIAALPVVVDRSSLAAAAGAMGTRPTTAPTGIAQSGGSVNVATDVAPPYRPLLANGSPVPGVLVSPDGSVAMLQMQFTTQVDALPEGTTDNVVGLAQTAVTGTGVTALPSDSLNTMHPPVGAHEATGLIIALLVLFLTLGSLWAAGLPIITALTGVGIGVGGAFALSSSISLTTATPALALMVGLAVGIDYALFIVNRQRRLILTESLSAADATARAVATAGSAVVFAGSTVIIALVGMTVIGIGFLTTMALVAASTVALAVLIALTLLPALLGIVGERSCSHKARAHKAEDGTAENHLAHRWVELLLRRPWGAVAGVVVILGLAAVPALSMGLGMPTGGTDTRQSTSRQSYDAITRGFGEGFNDPLVVVARSRQGDTLDRTDLGAITSGLHGVTNVASASLLGTNPDHTVAMFTVIPKHGPDDGRTAQLVQALRNPDNALAARTQVTFGVTGLTAVNLDITDRLSSALPEYLAIIVGLSLLLLLLVFRSVVIPITATAGFLLSIAATFGVTTAVFQWGWFNALVGLDTGGPLLSFLPIMVTGILYGLAMDYQVFLVSSMREAHAQHLPTRRAIAHGFELASRVVVAAAIIMTSVFASFVFSDDPTIKQFGFALAVGVVVDAFLVRMTLIPALMSLLGRSVWWLRRWLDRLLPAISVEGEGHELPAPAPHSEATTPAGLRELL